MQQLSIFLLIVISLVSIAVYFHYNREPQTFSKTLFGHNLERHPASAQYCYEKLS